MVNYININLGKKIILKFHLVRDSEPEKTVFVDRLNTIFILL